LRLFVPPLRLVPPPPQITHIGTSAAESAGFVAY